MIKKLLFLIFLSGAVPGLAQTAPVNGIRDEKKTCYALTGAILHIAPGSMLRNGVLIIEDGKIRDAGTNVSIPGHAILVDCRGKHIYPSFIELSSDFGMPELKRGSKERAQYESSKKGAYYWNEAVKPEVTAAADFAYNEAQAKELRSKGFGMTLTHQQDGIVRGTGAVVTLSGESAGKQIRNEKVTLHFSFTKGISTQEYPGSLTGTIALLRQFFYDADWYAKMKGKADRNLSLDAYLAAKDLLFVFDVSGSDDLLRAAAIAEEFGLRFIYRSSGDEYRQLEALKKLAGEYVIPVNFPSAYDVSDLDDADMVSLADMKHWETAPANPAILYKNGIRFSITSADVKSAADFFKNLRKTINYGLPEDALLQSLTTIPAKMLGMESMAGTLEKGKLANLIITEDSLSSENFMLLENWVEGKRYIVNSSGAVQDIRGTYVIDSPSYAFMNGKKLEVTGKKNAVSGTLHFSDTTKFKVELKQENAFISGSFYSRGQMGFLRMNAVRQADSSWNGKLESPSGQLVPFTARYVSPFIEKPDSASDEKTSDGGEIWYPNKSYGWQNDELSAAAGKKYLFRNAAVWTNETEGILQEYDVAVEDGKIRKIGKNLPSQGYEIIDGTGMHLTSGIIDEHSHIALHRGVNEATQSSTAEVRMADVVAWDDINIYRQLSGGVTMAQLLHGSANQIGGQSAIIKLRWGLPASGLLLKDAPRFIKFALGENVKQANWGPTYSSRYPQTRMGVEQYYYDVFHRAVEYRKNLTSSSLPVRRDLDLDALVEILDNKRFITCHSYVQSEINMLIHVADSMKFRVNTFTHILEGYKVADKMQLHGAFASTFADWWAYKMEVSEAIPYNAAILTRAGVVTAINSDDAEMARRLNQEAGKIVKYGGISEEEAWKMVTLNPAKMLHVDERTGSIRAGKDADLVLWSDNPLSIYARALITMIDGTVYYSEARDQLLRERIAQERRRLIQKMLQAKKDGEPTVPVVKKQQVHYHCDYIGEENYEFFQLSGE